MGRCREKFAVKERWVQEFEEEEMGLQCNSELHVTRENEVSEAGREKFDGEGCLKSEGHVWVRWRWNQ